MPLLELQHRSVLGDSRAIQLKPWSPSALLAMHLNPNRSSLLSADDALLSLVVFCYIPPSKGPFHPHPSLAPFFSSLDWGEGSGRMRLWEKNESVTGVPDPLLGHKNLLSNLYKNNKGIPCIRNNRKNESVPYHLIQRFVG